MKSSYKYGTTLLHLTAPFFVFWLCLLLLRWMESLGSGAMAIAVLILPFIAALVIVAIYIIFKLAKDFFYRRTVILEKEIILPIHPGNYVKVNRTDFKPLYIKKHKNALLVGTERRVYRFLNYLATPNFSEIGSKLTQIAQSNCSGAMEDRYFQLYEKDYKWVYKIYLRHFLSFVSMLLVSLVLGYAVYLLLIEGGLASLREDTFTQIFSLAVIITTAYTFRQLFVLIKHGFKKSNLIIATTHLSLPINNKEVVKIQYTSIKELTLTSGGIRIITAERKFMINKKMLARHAVHTVNFLLEKRVRQPEIGSLSPEATPEEQEAGFS